MADRIVDFERYCKLCKNRSLPEEDDICDECLDNPVKNDSRIPVNFDRDENVKEE